MKRAVDRHVHHYGRCTIQYIDQCTREISQLIELYILFDLFLIVALHDQLSQLEGGVSLLWGLLAKLRKG